MISRSIAAPALRRGAITATTRSTARYLSTCQRLPQRRPFYVPRTSSLACKKIPLQSRLLSTEVRTALDTATRTAPVVLFMKGTPETPQCGFSRTSIQILGLQGVDPAKFTAFNVLEDEDLRQGIKEYSNWPTIPQLYVDGEFVGGCDILMSMHKDGSLAELLDGKGVLVAAEGEGDGEGQAEKKE